MEILVHLLRVRPETRDLDLVQLIPTTWHSHLSFRFFFFRSSIHNARGYRCVFAFYMFQSSVAVYFLSHNSPSVFIFLQLVNTDHALPRPTSSDASFGLSRMPETTTFLVDSHTVSKNKKELKPPLLVMILAVQSLEKHAAHGPVGAG